MEKIEIAKVTLYLIGYPEFEGEEGRAMIIEGALDHIPVIYRMVDVQKQTIEVADFDESELNEGVIDDPARFQELLEGYKVR